MKKGYIQIYTGDGKGKTTAALGLAVRALGNGLKVCLISFLKYAKSGEYNFFDGKPNIRIINYAYKKKIKCENVTQTEKNKIKSYFSDIRKIINEGKYDLVILDEFISIVNFNILDEEKVIEVLKNKPLHLEIVLTGRPASEKLIEIADLVTEMKSLKHYFLKGQKARKGIEY